ncbi:MAG: dihydrolipoyl dehydrogenase [bacterium]|nr:dihydrolipoyl dehydrogenase [bacterium]
MSYQYDLIVIGAGPGGYEAAIRASQLGLKTAVVEEKHLGGICLNWGCIPTKALLKSAEMYQHLKHLKDYGLSAENIHYDWNAIIQRSRKVADISMRGVQFLFKKNKLEHLSGRGVVSGKNEVTVTSTEGKTNSYSSRFILLATGARTKELPNIRLDHKKIIGSHEAMSLPQQPKSMVIIGGGAIGSEFAYFYNAFGTKVTQLEMLPRLVPSGDAELGELLTKSFLKQGIDVRVNSMVKNIQVDGDEVIVQWVSGDKEDSVRAELALLAIGVTGNVENLGLEALGIQVEKGSIRVNSDYQTSVENIYAIGDCIGAPWLAHAASTEGIHAVEHMAALNPHPVNYELIPAVTYCQPQFASIGLTEEQVKERGISYKVGKYPFSANGKARAAGETEGLVKLIFEEKYGELLGAHLLGSDAGELIGELSIAKTAEATGHFIHHTIHSHPTLSEAIKEAAGAAYGLAINI